LTAVNSGTQRSEFTYNGLSQRVKIIEKTNGSVTSTKQLVWCPGDAQPCEERDASNNVTKRYYGQGVMIGTTKYFYTRDHLGSIRELTNGSGTVQTRYDYDPYGRRTRLTGTIDADFGFTGHYYHQPSGLHLALYRAYNADLGRWISRDPLKNAEVSQGSNLYRYVFNNPVNLDDPWGLQPPIPPGNQPGPGLPGGPVAPLPAEPPVVAPDIPQGAGPAAFGAIGVLEYYVNWFQIAE
jgi:RHS repeat-associated protein